jgi:signal transduction histidine kinase
MTIEKATTRPWRWGGAELLIKPDEPPADGVPSSAAGEPVKSVEANVLDGFASNAHWVVFVLAAQATFVAAALWDFLPTWLLLTWYVLVLLHGFVRARLRARYLADPAKDIRTWIRRLVLLSAINGVIWGGFGLAVAPLLSVNYRFVVLIVLTCLAAESGMTAITIMPRIWMAFLLPLLLPTTLYMLLGTQSQRLAALAVVLAVLLLFRFRDQHYRLARAQVALKADQQHLQAELEIERHKEAELLRNKNVFLEAAGHDLFQLVQGMGLLLRELRQTAGPHVLSRVTTELQRGLDSLHVYLSTVRDTVRVDSGTYICESFELPVQSILERVVAENQRMADDKGLGLRYRKSSALVCTDPTLVHSIISNFVSNAIRYTETGRIVVGVRRSGKELRVEVWDSGSGISKLDLPRVFRDFYRVSRQRNAGAIAMGMGLPLVARMARLLGSRVMARSALGKGSCFAISLPAATRRAPDASLIPPPSDLLTLFEQKSVLLLDSDNSSLQRTHSLLSSWKLRAHALTVDEASAVRLTTPQASFDVLIACLPRYDHAEHAGLLRGLRHHHQPKHTVLILDDRLDPDIAARLGATEVHLFYRPVPPWRLRMILWRLLS